MTDIFSIPFMQQALLVSTILGMLCASLGVYIVLRRMVFLSATLAQISTAGMSLALLFGWNPLFLGIGASMFSIAGFSLRSPLRGMPEDRLLGISYVGAFALSLLFVSKAAQGQEELQHLLQGNILTLTSNQVILVSLVCILVGIIYWTFRKTFFFVAFDPVSAHTQRIPILPWNLSIYLMMSLVISIGVQVSGVLLIFAFLVIPASSAFMISNKLRTVFLISIGMTMISTFFGLYLSFVYDLPSSPSIVALLLVFILLASTWKQVHSKGLIRS